MNPDEIYTIVAQPINLVFFSLIAIGVFLKNSHKVDDWKIPFILGGLGFSMGAVMFPKIDAISSYFDAAKQVFAGGLIGLVFAAISVYGHQLITQWGNRFSSQSENKTTDKQNENKSTP